MGKQINCVVVLIISIMVLMGCGARSGPGVTQHSDNTPKILGKFLQSDGLPAKGAIVTLQPADAILSITGGSIAKRTMNKHAAIAGEDGIFSIDSCAAGAYVIECIDENGAGVRIDSIIVSEGQQMTEVPPHSLQSLGALRGTVKLDAGGDASNVFVLAFGSERFVQAGSDGGFFMGDLPYGDYELKIVCVLQEYGDYETVSMRVLPGDTADVDTITLESQTMCIPQNVRCRYDSMKQIVTLKWDACPDPAIKGYNVYRYVKGAGNQQYEKHPLNADSVIQDCTFSDSTVRHDSSYVYGVASVSMDGGVSRKSFPLTMTTKFYYHADTLDGPTEDKRYINSEYMNLYWKTDDELLAVYVIWTGQVREVSIFRYGADFKLVQRSDIPVPIDAGMHITLDKENIYCHAFMENIVSSYNQNGQFRFSFNIDRQITQLAARNDTIFAVTLVPGSDDDYSTDAFDASGRLLFNLNDDNQLTPVLYGTDGDIYTTRKLGEDTTVPFGSIIQLQKHDFATSQMSVCATGSIFYFNSFIDVNKNAFMMYGDRRRLIVKRFDGEIVTTIDLPLESNWTNRWGVRNSRGQIAVIMRVRDQSGIVVLTPP